MKLIEEIENRSKSENVLVLFDMDGTLVEYGVGEKPDILKNTPGFYLGKLQIPCMMKVAERLSMMDNLTVGILSNCYYKEQREDKLKWLKKFAPFIDNEHKYILVYNELSFEKEEKDFLKVEKIKTITGFDKIYLIEDNHKIISATNKVLPNTAHHLSRLLV